MTCYINILFMIYFQISVDHDNAVNLAKKFLSNGDVKPAGLGSRDSLRLEAGLCLYGHDLNEDISPVEANLTWTIGIYRLIENSKNILQEREERKKVDFWDLMQYCLN